MPASTYGLTVVTPPPEEPVGLARARSHLRVATDADDPLIGGWIAAARELTESHTGRRWVTQSLRLTLPDWPAADRPEIALPVRPVSAVTAVKYHDAGGTLRTLDPGLWQTWLDHGPPLIGPAPATVWPTTQTGRLAAVQVEFTAGYGGAGAVPAGAKAAILLCLGYWYENRGDGRDPADQPASLGLPAAAKRLLDSLWTGEY